MCIKLRRSNHCTNGETTTRRSYGVELFSFSSGQSIPNGGTNYPPWCSRFELPGGSSIAGSVIWDSVSRVPVSPFGLRGRVWEPLRDPAYKGQRPEIPAGFRARPGDSSGDMPGDLVEGNAACNAAPSWSRTGSGVACGICCGTRHVWDRVQSFLRDSVPGPRHRVGS